MKERVIERRRGGVRDERKGRISQVIEEGKMKAWEGSKAKRKRVWGGGGG